MTNGALIALAKKLGGGGGGSSVTVEPLSVTANNTYTAPSGKAYSPVVVDVPDIPAAINRLEATHNGEYNPPTGIDGYAPVVVNVPTGGGGGGSLSDQVRFFDYDGTLVGSYSKADFNALTAMPSNPSHDGLTAQGWNWTLAQAKAQLTAVPDGVLNIGQMYTTSDGKTRIYIHIDDDTPSNRMNFFVRFTSSVANNVSIDWGDGTVETKGSTSATNYEHTYATGGDYVIKLTVNSGTISFVGTSGNSGYSIYGSRANSNAYNKGRIRKAEIGDKVTSIGNYAFQLCCSLNSVTIPTGVTTIGDYAFYNCFALTSVTIPSTVTGIGGSAFYNCYPLTSVTIPSTVTGIGGSAFYQCYSLTSITIPSTVTSIESSAFYNCTSLTSITIPSSVTIFNTQAFAVCYSFTSITIPSTVTSIGNNTFQNCYGMGEYHLKPTTPPTLANTNAFSSIQSDCVIYVPYSADHSVLNNYKTAQNWSTYADRMVEEAA